MTYLATITDTFKTIGQNFTDLSYIILFVIVNCTFVFLVIFSLLSFRQVLPKVLVSFFYAAFFISFILAGTLHGVICSIIFGVLFAVTILLCLIQNANLIHKYIANSAKTQTKLYIKDNYSKQDLISKVTTTVEYLSEHRIGALIAFEASQNIETYIKDGTKLNAPFTPELVESIFYEGTRLHDGAMVVRGTTILAASVFLPSTKKALVGKYGARHRAAMGFSEICDAVIVVVSEETGRISIANNGYMDTIARDEFRSYFGNIVNNEAAKQANKQQNK